MQQKPASARQEAERYQKAECSVYTENYTFLEQLHIFTKSYKNG